MRLLLDGRDISFKKVWLYFVPWSAWQTPGDHLVLPIVHEILAEGHSGSDVSLCKPGSIQRLHLTVNRGVTLGKLT